MPEHSSPTDLPEWKELEKHASRMRSFSIKDAFNTNLGRAAQFSVDHPDFLFDYSKNLIDENTITLLERLFAASAVPSAVEAQQKGAPVNETENRPVLHTALRLPPDALVQVDHQNVVPEVHGMLNRMYHFAEKVRSGEWKGYTGKSIRHIVNIGIGGSDLGPRMACEALKPYTRPDLEMHFVSNIDGADIAGVTANLDPARTLFVVVSKSFTTQETMTNARTARRWFLEHAPDESFISGHFIAVSTNEAGVREFGIDTDNMFGFWEWVGGRYSVWSAAGISLCLAVGPEHFRDFLAGAHVMDRHFSSAPFRENIPMIMAALGIWYRNFLGAETHAVIPYSGLLQRLPAYLQQADMESNGKGTDRLGRPVQWQTGPIIWGQPGTNGQHAFFQLLHQGTTLIPADFIAAIRPEHRFEEHHRILISNFLAQTEALMQGKSRDEVIAGLKAGGKTDQEIDKLASFMTSPGNRPSTTLLFKNMNPRSLGMLIALYEHKIFAQGVVWNIYSFDQWGVELGKQLASAILPELEGQNPRQHDSSTAQLISYYLENKEP